MELSRIYYWIWFCKNDSWKIYLNLRFCHNLAHVWHIFHIYENKNAPQINKNGPETWNAAPRVVPLTVLKFFMVDFFIFLSCKSSGCCWLVGLHCANGSPHMAAASFWPTCWTWWIVKRPSGCMFWPSLPRAFLSFFHFVSSSSTYALCLLIIRTCSLHTQIYYVRSSACLRCSDCWRFSSTLQTGLILNKGEGLELVVLQHSRGEWREVCVPGTRFLQHAVSSLQLSPSLMLPDRWGCVCMLFHAFCSWGWVRKEEGWGWWGGEGGGQPTGYG